MPRRAFALAAALVALAGCDPFNTGFEDVEDAVAYRNATAAAAPAPAGRIKVMTWNVKYGGARLRFFWECNGSRTLMTEGEVRANVDALAARIRAYDPDVVLLQEVDTWRSKRAAYVDEVQRLLDGTGLGYGAYASQWKADYVPSDGEGPIRLRERGAVALAHHLGDTARAAAQDRRLGGRALLLPEAQRARDARRRPGRRGGRGRHRPRGGVLGRRDEEEAPRALQGDLDGLAAAGRRVIAGGDLNAIPPGSPLREGFPEDQGCTDARFEPDRYVGEETWLDPLYAAYAPDVTPDAFAADPAPWFTFVGDEHFPLNRKLDHLFTNGRWIPGTPRALQDAILLSDHVPLVAEWEVAP